MQLYKYLLFNEQSSIKFASMDRYGSCLNSSITGCGIIAKKPMKKGDKIPGLLGLLAECPEDQSIWDDHFSLLVRNKKTYVMLGPISFLNHSCKPNVAYHVRADCINVETHVLE